MNDLIDPVYIDYLKIRRWLRHQLDGRNLRDFAREANLSHMTLYTLLYNKRKQDVRLGTLTQVAKGLNMTVSEMLQKAGL